MHRFPSQSAPSRIAESGKWACVALFGSVLGITGMVRADSDSTSAPSSPPTATPTNNTIIPFAIGGQGQTPPYTVVRWNEDYTYLRDPDKHDDFFDPIKYIPLDKAGDIYLTLGGDLRERYELFNHNSFGTGPQDHDGYWLTRLMAYGDLHLGNNFRFFVEGKHSEADERTGGARPQDADALDLEQAFGDFKLPFNDTDSVTLRVGRQYLLYGAQRLISPLDWTDNRRTFDGVKVSMATPGPKGSPLPNTLDAFVVKPVVVDKEQPDTDDNSSVFWGLYDTLKLPRLFSPAAKSDVEVYFLGLDQTARAAFDTAPPIAAGADTYTIGSRFFTEPKPFDLDTEADYQFGRAGDSGGKIDAYSLAVDGGYTAPAEFSPRLNLGFDVASGDRNPANPDKDTFNQLFPLGHAYLGYIDVVGRENIMDLHPGVTFTLAKDAQFAKLVTFKTDYHQLWRESSTDSLYNAAGGVQQAAVAGVNAKSVGSEIDLLLNWQVDRHLSAYTGYSHFFAGSFLHDTGPHSDIDFFYAALNYSF